MYDRICELIANGASLRGVFGVLQSKGVFDSNANDSVFYRAFKREQKRREGNKNNVILPQGEKVKVSQTEKTNKPEMRRDIEDGEEYEVNGKKYANWRGKQIFIPKGYCFKGGEICPDDEPEKIPEDKIYSFSDYPAYIQDAINDSRQRGTLLDDKDKNERLVKEWIEKQKEGRK